MSRPTRLVMCLLLVTALGPVLAWAAEPVATQSVTCADGSEYWLFASGEDAVCQEVAAGVFECAEPGSGNASRGGCNAGCEWARYAAGCQLVIDGQLLLTMGGVDLECPDGRVYHVKDDHGTCRTEHSRTAQGKAECSISDGTGSITTVSASCASGCTLSRPGTECMCEEGCDRAQGDAPGRNGRAAQSPRAAAR
ncbi:MAG: hypothetical protein Kow0062_27690 [Acidobacteriota bacterium]